MIAVPIAILTLYNAKDSISLQRNARLYRDLLQIDLCLGAEEQEWFLVQAELMEVLNESFY